jgi:hypothetical protein
MEILLNPVYAYMVSSRIKVAQPLYFFPNTNSCNRNEKFPRIRAQLLCKSFNHKAVPNDC